MKTTDEWLQAFNQYYNNLSSNKAPGIEPIEISRHLTDAQYTVVLGLYTGTLGASFESTEQVTTYLAPLVCQSELQPVEKTREEHGETIVLHQFFDEELSYLFELPGNLLYMTLEYCSLSGTACGIRKNVSVVPVTQDELLRTIQNPFKGPNGKKVLRLAYGEIDNNDATSSLSSENNFSELISKYPVESYTVRYLKKPTPIIVEDLPGGLSIDGYSNRMTCILPEPLHQLILAEAVRLAKAVWQA